MNVQHWSDEDDDVREDEYEGIICPACTRLHFFNRKTGKLLGQDDDMEKVPTPQPLPKKPRCVKCGGTMRFSCIEEEKPGFVHHVYECTKCRSTQSFVTPV